MVEVWTPGLSMPAIAVRAAVRAEAAGYDGMLVVDSQNLSADCYIALALAARETETLLLGTGVTNPFTRHPAVTASAIATVQAESRGRAVLGIGRGDSSLAHLGLAPAPVAVFERYVERVQGYLRGDEVPFGDAALAPVDTLAMADQPHTSRLHWLQPDVAKVPVDVAASGPKVIAAGARVADRVTFAVGADPARIAWAIDVARAARAEAGLDPEGLSLGAYVNVVAHPDRSVARTLAGGGLATFARFNVMHGRTAGPASDETRAALQRVHDAYDMTSHTRSGSAQDRALDDDVAAGFGVLGPAPECVERLRGLVALGLDRLVVVGPSIGADREEAATASRRFAEEVLPALR